MSATLLPKDFDGTLKAVHDAGYTEVEAAGYYDRTAADFRHSMDQAGLRCISTHHPLPQFSPRADELIEYGRILGLEYIVCPSPARRDPSAHGPLSLDDWHYTAGELNRIGEKVKAAGMSLGYHNHTPEFGTESGVTFYDELLRLTDPKLVFFEMDCGWVVAAGRNPIDYLKKSPERFPLLHVKDMAHKPDGTWDSTIMGHGVADYKAHPPRRHRAQALLHRAGRVRPATSSNPCAPMPTTCASSICSFAPPRCLGCPNSRFWDLGVYAARTPSLTSQQTP